MARQSIFKFNERVTTEAKDATYEFRGPVISVRNLEKKFGEHEVLKDISFDLFEGDVVCIIGSSGSGKSTLLRCINHLETPTSGQILYHGYPLAKDAQTINGKKQEVDVFSMGTDHKPAEIAQNAIAYAEKNGHNVVILDTAGRLHVDEDMMAELQEIKETVTVHQTLLVVDAMTGQDAVNVAKEFDEKVGVDGVILSKMDGDTRGGAALSIKAVTGKPILFVSMGEKLSDLEQFYPDRMASRILGMGDVLSLIDKAQASIDIDEEKSRDMAGRMKKGKFDFEDYLESMKQMRNMGGLSSILGMLPGMGIKTSDLEGAIDETQMKRTEAIVLSMTKEERRNPKILTPQRKHRIAKGAGVDIATVNRFIKQFEQTQKMMKQFGGGKKGRGGMGGMFGGGKFPGMGGRFF